MWSILTLKESQKQLFHFNETNLWIYSIHSPLKYLKIPQRISSNPISLIFNFQWKDFWLQKKLIIPEKLQYLFSYEQTFVYWSIFKVIKHWIFRKSYFLVVQALLFEPPYSRVGWCWYSCTGLLYEGSLWGYSNGKWLDSDWNCMLLGNRFK